MLLCTYIWHYKMRRNDGSYYSYTSASDSTPPGDVLPDTSVLLLAPGSNYYKSLISVNKYAFVQPAVKTN